MTMNTPITLPVTTGSTIQTADAYAALGTYPEPHVAVQIDIDDHYTAALDLETAYELLRSLTYAIERAEQYEADQQGITCTYPGCTDHGLPVMDYSVTPPTFTFLCETHAGPQADEV